MRAICVVMALCSWAVAEKTTAHIAIDHTTDWKQGNRQPIVISADGQTRRVAHGAVVEFDATVTKTNQAIAIDVQIPGIKSFRRWGVLVAGARYRMVGNPCAFWSLDTDAKSEKAETFRVDARKLPASAFPITVSTSDADSNDPVGAGPSEPSETSTVLAAPGISDPIIMLVSAMCPRSGGRVTVRSGKKVMFAETLIGHPGKQHTIVLRKPNALAKPGFDVVTD